jgi:SAM-dependent methyltransferase
MTHHDADTVAYFDEHVPEYSTGRLAFPAEVIRTNKREGSAIVDIGCGAGNTLGYLRDATGLAEVCGIDVSERLLARAREEVPGVETHLGSILDRELVERIGPRFDFAVIAAVLHHLIGRSKRESHALACQAVEHALHLLRPGGHLIVVDEAFAPAPFVNALFWVKKGVTRLTSRRVGLFGYWNNIGPPVVSYYSLAQLEAMTAAGGRAELVERKIDPERLSAPAGWLLRKQNVMLVARKAQSDDSLNHIEHPSDKRL